MSRTQKEEEKTARKHTSFCPGQHQTVFGQPWKKMMLSKGHPHLFPLKPQVNIFWGKFRVGSGDLNKLELASGKFILNFFLHPGW